MAENGFNLSQFLTDTLSLQINATSPTRNMFPYTPEDPYLKLTELDPLELLGEKDFGEPQKISENTIGTPIQEFFRGTNVFITGGTGFIGKVLTEKLIRSVPHLAHIYLLVREKRGKSSRERFDQLLEDQVFLRMKTEVPEYRNKITVVDGDISEPELGLSAKDRNLLSDQIHVVIHSAADVRFIEPLRFAINANVLGSKRVLDLAKTMKNLKAYIHVSTAYSQCVRRTIEEKVLKMSINYKEILKYIDTKTDEELELETPRIMQGWPNTYTFSKAVCENMVVEEAGDLPLCIVRPSVVVTTYKEPVRGWTDNLYGPTGVILGAGLGVMHCFRLNEDLTMDSVPVDYVANFLIAAAWRTGNNRPDDSKLVYNFTSTSMKPTCWKTYIQFLLKYKEVWPFGQAIWYTSYFSTDSFLLYEISYYLLHRIPGVCFDKLAELTGGKPRLSKIYKRFQNLKKQSRYFLIRSWEFKNDNVMALWQVLSNEDKNLFYFDVRDVDLKELLLISKLGTKYYLLKEKLEDLPAAQRKNTWLYWIHNSLKLICSLAALKVMVVAARALPF